MIQYLTKVAAKHIKIMDATVTVNYLYRKWNKGIIERKKFSAPTLPR